MIIAKKNQVPNPNEIEGIIFDGESTELDNQDEHRETIQDNSVDNSGFQKQNEQQKVVILTGKVSELCTVWQIRRNFLTLMFLLSSSSFCFFLINFQMKNVKGYLVTLTIVS